MDQNFYSAKLIHCDILQNNSFKNYDSNDNTSTINNKYTNTFQKTNENNFLIENTCKEICMKNKNDQFQLIQNQQEQKLVDEENIKEFDQITYRVVTQRKGKENKTQPNDKEQQQLSEDQKHFGVIFENQSSIVDLMFNFTINKFVVIKQNIGEKELFEKEYKILEKLKGEKITLDIVSTILKNQKFQQIAGKTTLFLLKQKTNETYFFQVFYFILFDKLNRLHEKGFAHSDIKPQNIVISYDNEPFLIDFGGSINLQNENDHENYLSQFTPNYNLKIYFEIFDSKQRKYKAKKFSSKEEIKLCDRTQLSLTFLYLLCDNQFEQELFSSKNYNQLFQYYINKDLLQKEKTKMLVLSHISQILNQADPSINIIGDKYESDNEFIICKKDIQEQIQKSNDIVYDHNNSYYEVRRIDKFSISLIYFLDKLNFDLQIIPQSIFITPLPYMKEYLFISQKYKINEYFLNLMNTKQQLGDIDAYNICEYVKAYKIRKLNIIYYGFNDMLFLFQKFFNSKSLNTFEFVVEFNNSDLKHFINCLQSYQPKLCAECFQIFEYQIICQVVKNSNQNLQLPAVCVKYPLLIESAYEQALEQYYKIIKINYEIKQLVLQYKSFYSFQDMIFIKDQVIINYLEHKIKQMNTSLENHHCIYFERSLNPKTMLQYEERHDILENQVLQNSGFSYCLKHKIQTTDNMNEFLKKIFQQQNQSNDNCLNCKQIISKIKQDMNLQVEVFTCNILKFKYTRQKITIKIYDYIFEQVDMWSEIQKFIESKNKECHFELIIVDCKFSKQVADIIKEIYSRYYPQVKFNNEFIEQQENEYDYLKYQLFIENKQDQSIQSGFQIIFFNYSISKQFQIKDKDTQDQKQNDQNNSQQKSNEFQNKNKIDIKIAVEIFHKDNQFQIDSKYLNLNQNLQISQQKLLFVNQFRENVNKINTLIKNILKNKKYNYILLENSRDIGFKFDFSKQKISLNLNIIFLQTEFQELCKTIYNNYSISHYKLFILDITSHSFCITQQTGLKELTYEFQEIFSFFEKEINNNQPYSKSQFFLFLSYDVDYVDLNSQKQYFIKNITNELNNFQKFSIANTISWQQFISLKTELSLLQIGVGDFYLDQNHFSIFFEEIENIFPQNKIYYFKDCLSSGYIIKIIYAVTIFCQFDYKIYFHLNNKIPYDDFQQFINDIHDEELNNKYIFKIKIISTELKNQFIKQFQDMCEINEINKHIILKIKKQESEQKQSIRIIIYFELCQFNFEEQPPTTDKSQLQIHSQNEFLNNEEEKEQDNNQDYFLSEEWLKYYYKYKQEYDKVFWYGEQLIVPYVDGQEKYYKFNGEYNKKSIDFLIEGIKNKKKYYDIHLCNSYYNIFIFDDFNSLRINLQSPSNQQYKNSNYLQENLEMIKQFKELYLVLYDIYYILLSNEHTNYSQQKISITQNKDYDNYTIIQKIGYKNYSHTFQDISDFLQQDINQNFHGSTNSENDNFLILNFSVKLSNIIQSLQSNDIGYGRKIFFLKLKDNFNDFFKYAISYQELISYIFKNKTFILQLTFGFPSCENVFEIYFQEIEKIFPQNKLYNLKSCKKIGQLLIQIYEELKTYELKHKLYFKFTDNKISYSEFKQFIYKIQLDDLNSQFIFKTQNLCIEMKIQFEKDFKDIYEINDIDGYLELKQKQLQQLQKQSQRIKILLEFDISDFKVLRLKRIKSKFDKLEKKNELQDQSNDHLNMNFNDIKEYIEQNK